MYIFLILFFISLFGIISMIGRKVVMQSASNVVHKEELVGIPLFEELGKATAKNAKKYGYISLVIIIRGYFRSTNFLKKQYNDAKNVVRKITVKTEPATSKETSKFLQMVGEYKNKIRKIKEEVEEEEKGL